MDKNYIEVLNIIENSLPQIKKLYNNANTHTFEDTQCCKLLENFIYDVDSFINSTKYYLKNTKEGIIKLNNNGKYVFNDDIQLCCGYTVEIFNEELNEWEVGQIEHSYKYNGYYFSGSDNNIALNDNMNIRIRFDE